MIAPDALVLTDVESSLGEPARAWKGRCYEIASRIVHKGLVQGTAVYGHWLGPVHKRSMFHRDGRPPFVAHGWIVLPDARVLDPTRWAFEAKKPYLFLGDPGKLYDEGGNSVRKLLRGPIPRFDGDEQLFTLTDRIMPSATWTWVEKYLDLDYSGDAEPGVLCVSQILYLANAPLDELGTQAAPVYAALEKLACVALIPHDNYLRVKAGRWP